MAQSNLDGWEAPKWQIAGGLTLFISGMAFGIIGAFQYILPGFLKAHLSFEQTRPLHVSSILFWILLTSTGAVLQYVGEYTGRHPKLRYLATIQAILFGTSVLAILSSYAAGEFGGREYWEFPPPLALLFVCGWLLFIVQVVGMLRSLSGQPVYIWMWITGAFGFLLTFTESYLWMLPHFSDTLVRDMAVQWKSNGSLVGSWNMLVYGLGIYLMEKISGNKTHARSNMAFGLFFLGLFNLMFNWSHHIYTLPVQPYIRHIGYLVSMTELFILGRIIYKWKDSVEASRKRLHHIPYRFLMMADFWIFFNLIIAILMSIPAINVYTHGTHITVAHVMGTTIGINSMLLMAVAYDLLQTTCFPLAPYKRTIFKAMWMVNASLLVFLAALFAAGIERSVWQMSEVREPFARMMEGLVPYFICFTIAGCFLLGGFSVIAYPLIRNILICSIRKTSFGRDGGHEGTSSEKALTERGISLEVP